MRKLTYSLPLFAVLMAAIVFGLVGCGGGGGGGNPGGGTLVTVTGRILRAESGQRPDPQATITIGGVSAQSGATDGNFSVANVPSSATQAVITATGAQTLTLPITLSTTTANNLGDIFISDTGYDATVTGRVVTTVNNSQQAVGNATVTIGGKTVQTDVNGAFSIAGLPVGLGTTNGTFGSVTATGFEPKPITEATLEFPLVSGGNALTNPIVIDRPVGSTPNPPYTIRGVVNVNGVAAQGVAVSASTSTGLVFGTTTGPGGTYFFWLAPDTYTITAQSGAASGNTSVTLTSPDAPVTASTINLAP